MKKTIFFAVAVLVLAAIAVPHAASAQATQNFQTEQPAEPAAYADLPRVEANHSVSLDLLGLTYAYELPVARRFSIIGRAGVDAGLVWKWSSSEFTIPDGGSITSKLAFAILPSLEIEPRFYYGLDRRASKGRNTFGNQGSFVSMRFQGYLPFGIVSKGTEVIGLVGVAPTWGMRRVWGDHWMFEFTSGVMFAVNGEGTFHWAPDLNVRFGYAF